MIREPLDELIRAAQQRLDKLVQKSSIPVDSPSVAVHDNNGLLRSAIAEISISLEELQVLSEELRQQNDELRLTRQTVETERQRYQDLFQFAPDGYLVTNQAGMIQETNQVMPELLHLRPSYLIGKPIYVFFHTDDRPRLRQFLLQLQQDGSVPAAEFQVYHAEGRSSFPVELSATIMRNRAGAVDSLLWLLRDISIRKQAETDLQTMASELQQLYDHAPCGYYSLNGEGIIVRINDTQLAMLGYLRQEMLGKSIIEFLTPESIQTFEYTYPQFKQRGWVKDLMFQMICQDGSILLVKTSSTAVYDEAGNYLTSNSIALDMSEKSRLETELRQVEDTLQTSEQRYRAILDNSPAVIYLTDIHNNILLANRRCADLLSTTAEDVIGKNIYDCWAKDIADGFAANNQQVLETQQLLQVEELVPDADGTRTYFTVKFPLYGAEGQPYAVCGISTDITEKKQLEERFYRTQRLESLGTLASGMAHDLNNVFTPILAIAQLLRMKAADLDPSFQDMLNLLVDSTKRGADLVKQVLLFTRGSERSHSLMQSEQVLLEVIHIAETTFPPSVYVCTEIPSYPLQPVLGDPTHLHQVFMNLCVNARDAMPNGGTLTITAENTVINTAAAPALLDARPGSYVVVTVADTGSGIPPKVMEHIFEPFYTTKATGYGTGLGLSTVLSVVKSHDGFIQVSSKEGQGTEFKIFLPIVKEPQTPIVEEDQLLYGNRELILIVDDETSVRQSIKALLEEFHYTTLVASDGMEAIALYTERQADINVVLLDAMMPTMDGITVIAQLKAINPQVKIVVASGLLSNQDRALAAGAQVFLPKPYPAEDILTVLHQLIVAPLAAAEATQAEILE